MKLGKRMAGFQGHQIYKKKCGKPQTTKFWLDVWAQIMLIDKSRAASREDRKAGPLGKRPDLKHLLICSSHAV